jgi:predicted membrane GTPase involved in stress response
VLPYRCIALPFHDRYVAAGELVEVTPGALRLRKRLLDSGARRAAKRRDDGTA